MPTERYMGSKGLEDVDIRLRPAPRCYSRQATKAARQPRVDLKSNFALLALSMVTGIAAFLAVSGGWSF